MGWSGGTYTKGNNATGGWTGDASLGIGIEAGRHDTQDNDFASGINNCLAKDGQNAMTGNLNLGTTNKIVNVASATARTDAPTVAQVQDGSFVWLGTTGGTATAQTATATPAITAYVAGQKFRAKIGTSLQSTGATNTAHTININSVGAKNIVNQDGTNPTAGTWVAAAIIELVYDGTNFVITNDAGGWQTYSVTVTGSGGMTTSGLGTRMASYRKTGKLVTIMLDLNFTIVAPLSNTIFLTTPVNSQISLSGTSQVAFGIPFLGNGGVGGIGQAYFGTASLISVFTNTSSSPPNWAAGSTDIRLSWSYMSI